MSIKNNILFFIALIVMGTLSTTIVSAQQLAFPTAEGSGRYATGGRGGTVYEVTNLNNSGAGSIVDAVSVGNRIIVFRVSGTIALGDVILRPQSNTTIAGQTAPGDGICLKGRIIIGSVSNVIIRYIRVRVDAGAANSSGDAIDIDSGNNIMIDHVSASYSRDEGISCQETSNNVTVQWSIISEALTFESHSYGSLVRGDYGDQKSYHHNLYAHNNNRNPRPGNYTATTIDPQGLYFDFRNNVIYNWKGSTPGYNADKTSTSRYNFVGNVCISGLESTVSNKMFKEDAVDAYAYFADNMYNGTVPADQWSLVTFNGFTQTQIDAYKARSSIISMAPVVTTSPAQAKTDVLASAGANYPKRDTIDKRIVQDVLNGTGHSIDSTIHQPEGGWPILNSTPPPLDSDHDGMPNDWEIAHGLNANDPADRLLYAPSGYTMIEEYLNSLTTITLEYTSIGVNERWNLVSVPRIQLNDSAHVIFPGKYGDMFGYNTVSGGYEVATILTVGQGYWAYYTSGKTETISGYAPSTVTIACQTGWNLIGSREIPVAASILTTVPAGLIFGDIFRFDTSTGGYSITTTLTPGEGIWVYVTGACTLTIP